MLNSEFFNFLALNALAHHASATWTTGGATTPSCNRWTVSWKWKWSLELTLSDCNDNRLLTFLITDEIYFYGPCHQLPYQIEFDLNEHYL